MKYTGLCARAADLQAARAFIEQARAELKDAPKAAAGIISAALDVIEVLLAEIEKAAAAIRELEAERDQWIKEAGIQMRHLTVLSNSIATAEARITELEAQVRESAMQELASLGQAQEAYEAQRAAEVRVAELTQERDAVEANAIMPEHVIRVASMLIESLHCLDTEAIQIATATNASGGVDGVQVLEDAEKIIKAAAGLVATELQGVAAIRKGATP